MSSLPANIHDSVTVKNVVASSTLGCPLDLDVLNDDIQGAEYNIGRFPGMIYRVQEPHVTILVFRSGKLVCTGSASVEESEDGLGELLGRFDEIGLQYNDPELTVQNVVGVANLDEPLNLNAIAIAFGLEHTEYEPEQFPGLVYRIADHSVVALLFGSGKMVITGGKSPDDITAGVTAVHDKLTQFNLL